MILGTSVPVDKLTGGYDTLGLVAGKGEAAAAMGRKGWCGWIPKPGAARLCVTPRQLFLGISANVWSCLVLSQPQRAARSRWDERPTLGPTSEPDFCSFFPSAGRRLVLLDL